MQHVASRLRLILAELKAEEKRLLELRKGGRFTGALGEKKSSFIDDPEHVNGSFLYRLELLAKSCEDRFFRLSETIGRTEPVSVIERQELQRIRSFLHNVEDVLERREKLEKIVDQKERLVRVQDLLREITLIAKEFYDVETFRDDLVRKVKEQEISPLLKKIYANSERLKIQDPQSHELRTMDVFRLTKLQLQELQREADAINACRDAGYELQWRNWWRDEQLPEVDTNTGLYDPHINVTMRLFGGRKKDIHILLAA